VRGVVIDGITHAAFFDEKSFHTELLQLNASGETGGAGADDEGIVGKHN
jgi:hypothetical protein